MDSAKINNIFRISKPNLPQAHINLNERWNGGILSHDPELVKNKCETWAALFFIFKQALHKYYALFRKLIKLSLKAIIIQSKVLYL